MPNYFCETCLEIRRVKKYRLEQSKNCRNCGEPSVQFRSCQMRRFVLKIIGFKSYTEYLRSDLWMGIRERVFEKYGRVCSLDNCDREATQIHHKNYTLDTMIGKSIVSLSPICGRCHKCIEYHPDGKKNALAIANRKLKHGLGVSDPGKLGAKYRSRPEVGRAHARRQKRKRNKARQKGN